MSLVLLSFPDCFLALVLNMNGGLLAPVIFNGDYFNLNLKPEQKPEISSTAAAAQVQLNEPEDKNLQLLLSSGFNAKLLTKKRLLEL